MSGESIDEHLPTPEYELDQYFPREREITSAERDSLREQHGYVRAYFLMRPARYRNLQRWLNQARFGTTYDEYLGRTVWYALAASLIGLIVGLFVTAQLAAVGAFGGLSSPVPVAAGVARFVSDNRVWFAGGALTVASTVVLGGGTWAGRYYFPRYISDVRSRSINVDLPHAIVYMYALSSGGMTTFEVIRNMAGGDEVYGEVANEFDMIVRDVELFGNDLFTALRDARNLTPSDNMEQFLDDMISVLDSGSDFTVFLRNESQTYMEEAKSEQDDFLETLSILSEIFVVAFVAAPLFFIVTLIVLSLLGGNPLTPTFVLVYVILPLGMFGYLIIVDLMSAPFAQTSGQLDYDDDVDPGPPTDEIRDDPDFEEYWRRHRWDRLRDALREPLPWIRRQNPLHSLVVTVPLAVLVLAFQVVTGAVSLSLAGFEAAPIETTVGVAVIPFLVAAVPLSVLYEAQRRRQNQIARRFPDTLNILSSANEMGIRLTESLDLVSRWSEGILAIELRKVHNDIEWNHDVRRALIDFANRLSVPQVTRTMKLVAEGARSSTDLADILSVAAEDTRNRYKIERKRRSTMGAYIAIVLIGFLVYLTVVVLIDVGYLQPIAEMAATAGETEGSGPLLNVQEVPVETYRLVFFHSALIQGTGSGLLAGKLAENDAVSGLKYSIALVLLTLGVFFFV